ncbi:MAG: peptide chain release factor N(5)-glutamine methyltransferase [bacterium]
MRLEAQKTWHILEILNYTSDILSKKGIQNSRLNAEHLLSYVLNINRVELYLNYDRPLSKTELERFKFVLSRRLNQEPLQYILGETEFMSLPIKVNPAVLIPRPETEILAEKVLEKCNQRFNHKSTISILDIGTGSGCIAVSLAKYLENSQVTALDISEGALRTAHENAHSNNVEDKIQFLKSDFLDSKFSTTLTDKFDVVVCNPPYVSVEDFSTLPEEVKNYEPTVALKDGKDGLTFYHKIADFSLKHLNPEGFVAVEVGLEQARPVKRIFLDNGYSDVKIFKDLSGIERVLICEN